VDAIRYLKACPSWADGFGFDASSLRRAIPSQRSLILGLMLPIAAAAVRGLFSSPEV
jgi:hypothetical protein